MTGEEGSDAGAGRTAGTFLRDAADSCASKWASVGAGLWQLKPTLIGLGVAGGVLVTSEFTFPATIVVASADGGEIMYVVGGVEDVSVGSQVDAAASFFTDSGEASTGC